MVKRLNPHNAQQQQQQQQQQQHERRPDNSHEDTTENVGSSNVTWDESLHGTDILNIENRLQTPFTLLPPVSNGSNPASLGNADNDDIDHNVVAVVPTRTSLQPVIHCSNDTSCNNNIDHSADTTTTTTNAIGITERTKWGPSLSLPDIDDRSMNYTFLYMEHYKVDLIWSMFSDSFFILGGISYIVLSGWDYHIYKNDVSHAVSNDNDDNNNNSNNSWYVALDLIAPTVYLVNSIIDIQWAEAVRLRLLNKHDMTKIWDEARWQLRGISFTSSSLSSTYDYSNELDVQRCFGCTWCYRMRKYAAHRRTMMAALSFGIAASLAVLAAMIRNFLLPYLPSGYDHIFSVYPWLPNVDSILDALSDHVYIISAIFSMTGKRHRPWFAPSDPCTHLYNDSERLEDLGDLLFFIGSLVDATLSDFQLKHLVQLPIFSSILWMVDGCLYMRSDIVKTCKLRDEAIASQSDEHPIKFII